MKVFRPIGIWRTAGLSDKATSYFRNQTPENEKILLLASEKACSVLFRKMGKKGRALAQDKTVFDRATKDVFNLLKEKGDGTAPEWFGMSLVGTGAASTALSFGISFFAGVADFWRISLESWSAGKAFLLTTTVSAFMGHMSNYPRLSNFREDIIRAFFQQAGPALSKLEAQPKAQNEKQKAAPSGNLVLD